ncbi:tRNA N6-adenosine threonylcarbamoyltransferase [Alphaproteobacteria bacterium]
MQVLGIETSCDETAIAVVDENKNILLNKIYSQIACHQAYGGVVPEIAARNHLKILPRLLRENFLKNSTALNWQNLDYIAVTAGPGLIGGLIVGVMVAKGLSSVLKKPIIAVNHLEGHALTPRLTFDVNFPYLLLLISGGHCQILVVRGVGKYKLISQTLDDAVGEVFDKVAKMLNLEYPGGPIIEKIALNGNCNAVPFPKAFYKQKNCDFSFSGLKTAVMHYLRNLEHAPTKEEIADICASFQHTVTLVLKDRLEQVIEKYGIGTRNHIPHTTDIDLVDMETFSQIKTAVIAGGVAANQYIRLALTDSLASHGLRLIAAPIALCTDNGAMIAWAGLERARSGLIDTLDFAPRSRWPLTEVSYVKSCFE